MQHISKEFCKSLILFLQEEVNKRNFYKVVVGLSGGIDSAVVVTLCKKAFQSHTKALLMPSLTSSSSSIQDSLALCEKFQIDYEILPIKNFDNIFCQDYPQHTPLARGNFCARMRMITLYHISQMEQRLVIGTSNKSERMLGYGTLYGDLACAINPIGNLYKTQIYELAKLLDIPKPILNKAPSADLYDGQSDEAELGYSYKEIDKFLDSYEKHKGDINKLSDFPQEMIVNLSTRIKNNTFKQELPKIFMF